MSCKLLLLILWFSSFEKRCSTSGALQLQSWPNLCGTLLRNALPLPWFVSHMEKNVLWAKFYLFHPPPTQLGSKGNDFPNSRPTLDRRGGATIAGKKCPTHFGQDCSSTESLLFAVCNNFNSYICSNYRKNLTALNKPDLKACCVAHCCGSSFQKRQPTEFGLWKRIWFVIVWIKKIGQPTDEQPTTVFGSR